jgi:GAF domain-containing protein
MDEAAEAAANFARISRELLTEPEEGTTLRRVVDGAVEIIAAGDFCGISLRRKGGAVETPASTDPMVDECDALQYELGEGPCLDAISVEELYLIEDTRADIRWPNWAPRVAAKGVSSIMSVRLTTDAETLGSLNVYARKPYAFGPDDIDLAVVYAAHAATALTAARLVTGLSTALQTRHMIGVAQGIIMQRYGVSLERSFQVMRRYSSHANVKLRDVAELVVDSGGVPGPTTSDRQ